MDAAMRTFPKNSLLAQVDDLVEKADRAGPHKYIKKYQSGGHTVYVYPDKETGKEKHRIEGQDLANLLHKLGNYLDGIDDVSEINKMGFNKFDKGTWQGMKPEVDSIPRMKGILKKYKRQLTESFGKDPYEHVGFHDDKGSAIVPEYNKFKQLEMPLRTTGRISRKNFMEYVSIHKEFGFRFNPSNKVWYLPNDKTGDFDIESYREKLGKLKIFVTDLPDPPVRASKPEEVGIEGLSAEELIQGIRNRQISNIVVIKRHDDGKFSFHFPYDQGLVDLFSNKSGALTGITEYNPNEKSRETFDIELVNEAIEKIKSRVPDWKVFDFGVKEATKEKELRDAELRKPIPEVHSRIGDGLSLFAFQNEGVRFLQKTDGNALIGDEMGLGKTIQVLAWTAAENKRILVVCPKVVRRTWIQEAEKFFPGHFNGNGKELVAAELLKEGMPSLLDKNIVTVNYESLGKFKDAIEGGNFDAIIIDESHRMKNPKAKQTQNIQELAKNFKHKILLSGTAIKNKKEELHTQIDLIAPGKFTREQLKYGTIGGVWNSLKDVYIARQKRNVLPDLPSKTTQITEIQIDGMPEYGKLDIGDISRLKNTAAISKTGATAEFVKEILNSSGSSVLVFSDSVEAAKKIVSELGESNAILHHGQMSDDARENIKEKFQNPSTKQRVLVSTRQSLAVGATLHRADKVVFNDLPWTAADLRQAEDRAHRIGQKNNVNVYWITAKDDPWDKNVSDIIKRKYELNRKLNEGKQLTSEEREWMEKPMKFEEVVKQIQGKEANQKNIKKSLLKEVNYLTKGRTPAPIGTISKDKKSIRTAQGWEYIKEPGATRGRKKGSKNKVKVENPEGTPRGDAERETKKQFEDQDEYAFARESTVGNKGEDLLGSARHKRNEWKNLQDAEQSGAAETLITRDKLLKNEPINLFPAAEINSTGAITAYYMMQKFPKAPDTKGINDDETYYQYKRGINTLIRPVSRAGDVREDEILNKFSGSGYKTMIRQQYYESYKQLSDKVTQLALENKDTGAMISLVRAETRELIDKFRRGDYYSKLANQFVKYNNGALKTWGRSTNRTVSGSLHELNMAIDKKHRTQAIEETGDIKQPTPDEVKEYVKQILEGKKLEEIFDFDKKEKGPKGFSAVEQYVDHAERKGPPTYIKGRKRQENFILKKAQMRGLQWGNSVTDEERDHHLQHIADSFKDLTDILGLPDEMGSFNGKLGLAVGARGHGTALAHYESSTNVINLTRKSGVGSLAHEWGHFFDNVVGNTVSKEENIPMYSMARNAAERKMEAAGVFASAKLSGNMRWSRRNKDGDGYEEVKPSEESQKMGAAFRSLRNELDSFTSEMRQTGEFKQLSHGKQGYWSSTIEVFARSFERYVQHKLHKNDRENTYLTGVKKHPFWPNDEAIKKMEPHFDNLFEVFKNSSYLKKALSLTQEVDELIEKATGHKYIKRTGSSGNYKYWYKDPSTGRLIEGKEFNFNKKGEDVTREEADAFILEQDKPYRTYVKKLEDVFRKLEGVKFSVSRMKATKSLFDKMHDRFKNEILNNVGDVVAARVIVSSIAEQKKVFEIMKKPLKIREISNNVEKARPGGYRAIHISFEMPGGRVAEYQLKTLNQQIFSRFAHDTVYKPSPKYAKLKGNSEVTEFLDKLSDYLYNLDVMREPGQKPKEPRVMLELGLRFRWGWLKSPPKGIEKGGWE